jgi:hypothetical protein
MPSIRLMVGGAGGYVEGQAVVEHQTGSADSPSRQVEMDAGVRWPVSLGR